MLEPFDERHSIASLLAPVDVPPDQVAQVRAAQLQSVDRLSVLVVLVNLLNAAIIMMMFRYDDQNGFLGLWGSALCMACAFLFLRAMGQSRSAERMRSQSDVTRYSAGAFAFGMIWGALPVILVPSSGPAGQIAVGLVLFGLIFGAAMVLSRLPQSAFAFAIPVISGLLLSIGREVDFRNDYLAVLAVLYLIVIAVCVRWNYNQFILQHINKAAIGQQNQLIGLLLRDFEESTSDWLWQTNTRGALLDIPLSLNGAKLGYEMMRNGQPLVDMFAPSEPRNVLQTSLDRRTGFRDLVLQVGGGQRELRWWSLTGKPLVEEGVFMGFRGVASDVTASKQIEDKIAYMAHYDGLTGLPNRASFQEKFERALSDGKRGRGSWAIALLDLDNFKWVNDTLGHSAGDELLRQLGRRLTEFAPPSALVARLGGDEFALFIEMPNRAAIEKMLGILVAELGKPYDIWGSIANCGASIGVRLFSARECDAQTLMTHADLALYQAKSKGKGQWCRFTPDLDAKAKARRIIESDLQSALHRDELYLKFQPIVDASTMKLTSCETLLRWRHPERGEILPGEFIEHAEDCGLIARMGDWVIREALSQARQLPEHVRLSVNISPLQLHSSSLLSTIVNALATNGISANRLDLEITESVLISDTAFALDRLLQLRKLGLSLSLDDFGTGFSSMSYLRSFPFDKVKIDKSFISDLETNEDSRAITRATIGLAKSLGLKVTAEGVETAAQRDFLLAENCDELQGFLISRARLLDEIKADFLKDTPRVMAAPDTVSKVLIMPDAQPLRAAERAQRPLGRSAQS